MNNNNELQLHRQIEVMAMLADEILENYVGSNYKKLSIKANQMIAVADKIKKLAISKEEA